MSPVEIVLAFLAGLLIGSFLNVCVFRLPRDLSVVTPARSFCPDCAGKRLEELGISEEQMEAPDFKVPGAVFEHSRIAWYDNIPLLSYVLLRGKCRRCHSPIPLHYPLVELATGIVFAIAVAKFGVTLAGAKYALLSAILVMLTASDAESRILPDEFTLGGLGAGLLFAYFLPMQTLFGMFLVPFSWGPHWQSVAEAVLGAALTSGAIWFVGYLYQKIRHRDGMGLGDVKMIAMVGAFTGLRGSLTTLMLASLLGAVLGLAYIKITKQDTSTYELPFGSFIGIAGWIVATFGLN